MPDLDPISEMRYRGTRKVRQQSTERIRRGTLQPDLGSLVPAFTDTSIVMGRADKGQASGYVQCVEGTLRHPWTHGDLLMDGAA